MIDDKRFSIKTSKLLKNKLFQDQNSNKIDALVAQETSTIAKISLQDFVKKLHEAGAFEDNFISKTIIPIFGESIKDGPSLMIDETYQKEINVFYGLAKQLTDEADIGI